MSAHIEGCYPLTLACDLLNVSRSAYYAYRQGKSHILSPSKQMLSNEIKTIFDTHLRRYGTRRIAAELRDKGFIVGRFAVGTQMRLQNLKAIQPRSFVPKTTQTNPLLRRSDNLLLESSPPTRVNEVYFGDITYISMSDGSFTYLATWTDLYSRYIAGWEIKEHMRASLVFDALKKAFIKRKPPDGIIIHSDGGGQYMDTEFRIWLDTNKARQSMTRVDNHYDNAHAESLFSRIKAELIQTGVFDSLADARTAIFEYIETYYNRKRRHSALGYLSPENFEKKSAIL